MVDASEQDQLHGFYLVHFDRVDPRGEAFRQARSDSLRVGPTARKKPWATEIIAEWVDMGRIEKAPTDE